MTLHLTDDALSNGFGAVLQRGSQYPCVVGARAPDSVLGRRPVNIVGTRNVLEAARRTGIRRVVIASSSHANGMATASRLRASASDVPHPANMYGVSKAIGEILARYYAECLGVSAICLRIGWIGPDDDRSIRPPDVDAVTERMWISHRDLRQIVRRAMSTELAYGVFYAMSSGARGLWDIEDAALRLGYQPQD